MRNLIKIETKATLNTETLEVIKGEVETLSVAMRTDVISASRIRLNNIIDNCINAAYQLGKIDAKKEMDI